MSCPYRDKPMSTRLPTHHHAANHHRTSNRKVRITSKLQNNLFFSGYMTEQVNCPLFFSKIAFKSRTTYETAVTFLNKLHLTTASEFFTHLVYKHIIMFYNLAYTTLVSIHRNFIRKVLEHRRTDSQRRKHVESITH